MKIRTLSFVLLIFSIAVVSSLAILLRPENLSSNNFYAALLWVNFLVFLNWYLFISFFSKNEGTTGSSTTFGILPSIHLITILYTVITVGLLLFFWRQSDFQSLSTSHWILQVLSVGIYGALSLSILISAKTAETPGTPQHLETKTTLLKRVETIENFLELQEQSLDPDWRSKIRALESAIKHSVPHPSALRDQETYLELSGALNDVLENRQTDDLLKEIQRLVRLARNCK